MKLCINVILFRDLKPIIHRFVKWGLNMVGEDQAILRSNMGL